METFRNIYNYTFKKQVKIDNSKAMVPVDYFSDIIHEMESYDETDDVDGDQDIIGTFEFDELKKGNRICLILDNQRLKVYPEKVHIFMGGSGGYYSYYMGVSYVLQKNFKLDNVIFSGVSGGTIVNLFLALNIDIDIAFKEWNIPLLNIIKEYKLGSLFNFSPTALSYLKSKLPDDAYKKVRDRYYVFTTEFYYLSKWNSKMLGEWENNDELCSAIMASCQIPILLGGNVYTYYRNQKYIDGCATYDYKENIHSKTYPSIKIYANLWRPYKLSWLWCWTSSEWHNKIYEWGKQDAEKNIEYFQQFLQPI